MFGGSRNPLQRDVMATPKQQNLREVIGNNVVVWCGSSSPSVSVHSVDKAKDWSKAPPPYQGGGVSSAKPIREDGEKCAKHQQSFSGSLTASSTGAINYDRAEVLANSQLNKWSLPSYQRKSSSEQCTEALQNRVKRVKSQLKRAKHQLDRHETQVRNAQRRNKERLVGIELNPGPPKLAPDAGSSSRSRINGVTPGGVRVLNTDDRTLAGRTQLKNARYRKLVELRVSKKKQVAQKAFKNQKGTIERHTRSVAAAVLDSVAQEQGKQDAAKELQLEKVDNAPVKSHEELVQDQMDKAKIDQRMLIALHNTIPQEFYVVSCVRDSWGINPGVAVSLDTLPFNVLPHRVLHYRFLEMKTVIGDPRASYFKERKRLTGGLFFDLIFEVIVYNAIGGSCDVDKVVGHTNIVVPWELFQVLNWRRYGACGQFRAVYERVAAFVPWYEDLPIANLQYTNYYLVDNCLTALLILPFVRVEGDGLWDSLVKFVCGRGLREVYCHGPAEGVYSSGYKVTWAEILGTGREDFAHMRQIVLEKTSAACRVMSESVSCFKRRYEKVLHHIDVQDDCRRFPCFVKQVVAPFPDMSDVKNHLAGMWRRLCRKQVEPTAAAKTAINLVVQAWLKHLVPLVHINWDRVITDGASRYPESQREGFIKGATLFVHFIMGGGGDAPDPADGRNTIADEISEFIVFLKKEFYNYEEIKSNRYITSPTLVGRAMLYCGFGPVEHELILQLLDVLAKGLTKNQLCARLGEKGGDPNGLGLTDIWGTDLNSMERLVSGWMQEHIEHVFIEHMYKSCPEGQRILQFFAHLLNPVVLQGPSMKIMVDSMRYSGTQQTSIGNALCNMVWSSVLMFSARYGRLINNDEDALEAVAIIKDSAIFEGDDGFIRVNGSDDRERFVQTALDLGLDLKFENHPGGAPNSNFCQLIYTYISGKLVVLADPAKIASRLSYFFCEKYKHTLKYDRELQVAKLFSYAERFRGCPVVSQIIVTFLKHYDASVQSLLKLMRSQEDSDLKLSVAKQLLTNTPGAKLPDIDLKQKADDFENLYKDIDSISLVDGRVYDVMANAFNYSAEQLRRMHTEAQTLCREGSVRLNGVIEDYYIDMPSLGEKFRNIRSRVLEVAKIDERLNARNIHLDRIREKCSGGLKTLASKSRRFVKTWMWDLLQVALWVISVFVSLAFGMPYLVMALMSPWIISMFGIVVLVGAAFFLLTMYVFFGSWWLKAMRVIIWTLLVAWIVYIFFVSPFRHLQEWLRKKQKHSGILDTFLAKAKKWARGWKHKPSFLDEPELDSCREQQARRVLYHEHAADYQRANIPEPEIIYRPERPDLPSDDSDLDDNVPTIDEVLHSTRFDTDENLGEVLQSTKFDSM